MFRLTGGLYRGKKLHLPPEDITRPTSSRAREALFNCLFSLEFNMAGANVIDGFAGSGAIGLECLSRGARFCTFIESHPNAQTILKENIKMLKLIQSSEVLSSFKMLEKSKVGADFIFLDPPYFSKEEGVPLYTHAIGFLKKFINPRSIIVIETDAKEVIVSEDLSLEGASFLFEKIYGTVKFSFYTIAC